MTMLLACLLAQASTETYDLATFQIPAGKRVELEGSVTFVDATSTAFCQYMVGKALPSAGDAAKDFDTEWAVLVAKPYTVKEERKAGSAEWPGGWTLTLGAAPVHVEGAGDFVSILAVFSGHGRRVGVLVNFNDESFRAKVDRFLESIRLAKPAAPAAAVEGPGGPPPLKGRPWSRGLSQYSMWGFKPTAAEFSKVGNQGYSKWSYVFQEDGAYVFTGEYWSMNKHTEYWFYEESGVYVLEGDRLSLAPKKARRILRDKEGKAQGEPAEAALEPAAYRHQFHYFEGIREWNLILTPEGEKETRRDGPFSSNGRFPNSYLHSPPPAKR